MEKTQTPLKHGVLKSNCIKKKKKLHQVLRKIREEEKSDSVKANSSQIIDTRIETSPNNALGEITDLISQNVKFVDAKSVKGISRNIIKHNNKAPPTKDGVRKTLKKINICKIKSPPLSSNKTRNNIDNDHLFPGKATVKQQKRNGKVIKKSVMKGDLSIVEEKCQGNCVNEFHNTVHSNGEKNPESFLQRNNPIKIDTPAIPSCEITLAQREKNIGYKVSTTNGVGKKKVGKLLNIKKRSEKEEICSVSSSSLETSVKELEIENSVENSLQMYSEMNENSFESMSSPICVEMHGRIDASSNLFNNSLQRYQMHAAKRVVSGKECMTWKQSNIPSSNQWKVCMGQVVCPTPWNTDANQLEESVLDQKMTVSASLKTKLKRKRDNLNNDESGFQLIKLSRTEMLMVLYPHESAFFRGICALKVLWGSVDVLGYKIHGNSKQSYTINSPWNFHKLGIHACGEFQHVGKEYYNILVKTVLPELQFKKAIDAAKLRSFPMFSCFILFQSQPNILSKFLNLHITECFQPFASAGSKKIQYGKFFNPRKANEDLTYMEKTEWIDFSNDLMKYRSDSFKVMVCGGKSVGKSYFLRFLTNRMISSSKEILYIDLDPGQCEFTPPGCVSAVIVKDPLLGPNFTHFINPERCIFLGRVDVSKCPLQYLQSVELLLQECTSADNLSKMPWVINTMGFSQGVGVDLTIACIKLVFPTDLVQIESKLSEHNFPFELECSRVNVISVDSLISCEVKDVKYDFHTFLSPVESRSKKAIFMSSKFREIAVLAYFCKSVEISTLSLLASPVHELPFNILKLCICHEKVNYLFYLSAMNANVVGLCNVGDRHGLVPTDSSYPEIWTNTPISNCYGMGIVRGVDMERKKIFIIAPLPSCIIKKVNCLALGAIYLPETVYTLQKEVKGIIPYVTDSTGLVEMAEK